MAALISSIDSEDERPDGAVSSGIDLPTARGSAIDAAVPRRRGGDVNSLSPDIVNAEQLDST
jgi:hypothetical protein